MSVRAILLGLLLAGLIPFLHHFNDFVLSGRGVTGLIQSLLPPVVIAVLIALLLAVNPLLRLLKSAWVLRPGEIALIVGMVFVACYWPGAVFNTFVAKLAMPAHWHQTNPAWQDNEVMSYVPGASPRFGAGHVLEPGAVAVALSESPEPRVAHVRGALPADARETVAALAGADRLDASERRSLVRRLNELVEGPSLDDPQRFELAGLPEAVRAVALRQREGEAVSDRERKLVNRWLLVETFPAKLLPPPRGGAVLPVGGEADPDVTDAAVTGMDQPRLAELPWAKWWPTIWLWCGLGLLFCGMALCLALIVHPQWSQRELLAYPVARVIEDATAPAAGSWLPKVMHSKFFWGGVVAIGCIRMLGGLNEWFPDIFFFTISLRLDFTPLLELFPNAARLPGAHPVFGPTIYPIVFALSFFLAREVSLSLGLAGILWMVMGSTMIAYGIPIDQSYFSATHINMMLFGAYFGAMMMVLYVGRHYYLRVASNVLIRSHREEVPTYVVWAARTLLVFAIAAVLMLTRQAGLDWPLSVLCVFLTVMLFLMLTRIHVETGAIFIQPFWFPFSILTGLLGIEAIGPTAFIVMALMTMVLLENTTLALMPMIANALRLTDRRAAGGASADTGADADGGAPPAPPPSPGRAAPWLGVAMVVSLVAAVGAAFYFVYDAGLAASTPWRFENQPSLVFNDLARWIAELAALDRLAEATALSGLERFSAASLDASDLRWMGAGFALVLGCSFARFKLSWWPIHPVLFLVLGTYTGYFYAASFLMGWLAKTLTVQFGGASAYERMKPMMIGIIIAEVGVQIFWLIIAASYYLTTGTTP